MTKTIPPGVLAPHTLTPAESDGSDVQVSDLDSDLELEELIPAYLKIKAKLYTIDPQLVESTSRKPIRGTKLRQVVPPSAQTPGVRKLLAQLQQLTSDALFDEDNAEVQWPAKRNEIAQEQATKRQQDEARHTWTEKEPEGTPIEVEAEEISVVATEDASPIDDDNNSLLGDMFSATPDQPADRQSTSTGGSSTENVTLRDFGKGSGVTPRKVLEEAVRSRWAR